MRNTITVMNAKGGVGKSTLILALAETLSAFHGKKILVIDSDAQASISHMLLPQRQLEALQDEGQTIVDYLIATVLKDDAGGLAPLRDRRRVGRGRCTHDRSAAQRHQPHPVRARGLQGRSRNPPAQDGRRLPQGGAAGLRLRLRSTARPGLSVLTECWLREADFYLSPTRPDYISTRGLAFMRKFRQRNPEMGFAELLGVIVNMKDPQSPEDDQYDQWLRQDPDNRCFSRPILRVTPLQSAAYFSPSDRSYWAKYPGQTGDQLRHLTDEFLHRVSGIQNGQRR